MYDQNTKEMSILHLWKFVMCQLFCIATNFLFQSNDLARFETFPRMKLSKIMVMWKYEAQISSSWNRKAYMANIDY